MIPTAPDAWRDLHEQRLLPVVTDLAAGSGREVADVLVAGGLRIVEVTLRRPHSLQRLAEVAAHPDVVVGAGTVIRAAQVDTALEAGARFVVCPGLDPRIVERCLSLGVPVVPGVGGASDVMTALRLGVDVVKLFPAALLGGPAAVTALGAPFPSVRFVPSGGVDAETAPAYLDRPATLAVSGSWATPEDLLLAGDTDGLRRAVDTAVPRLVGTPA